MRKIIPDFEQQAEAVFCSRKKVGDLGSLRVFFCGGEGLVKSPRRETLGGTQYWTSWNITRKIGKYRYTKSKIDKILIPHFDQSSLLKVAST